MVGFVLAFLFDGVDDGFDFTELLSSLLCFAMVLILSLSQFFAFQFAFFELEGDFIIDFFEFLVLLDGGMQFLNELSECKCVNTLRWCD